MHHVEILASSECGHCRHATDIVTEACLDIGAEVHAIDLSRHPHVARERYGLLESPVVVLDGRVIAIGGVPALEELRRLCAEETPLRGA